jgi:hypothetical protein
MARSAAESTIFLDPRGRGRAMRVTWHSGGHSGEHPGNPDGAGLVVVSLWRDNLCVGSFRLPAEDVPDLVHALTRGLARATRDPMVDTA